MQPKVASSAAATPGNSSGRRESASKQVGIACPDQSEAEDKEEQHMESFVGRRRQKEKGICLCLKRGETDSALTTTFPAIRTLSDY